MSAVKDGTLKSARPNRHRKRCPTRLGRSPFRVTNYERERRRLKPANPSERG